MHLFFITVVNQPTQSHHFRGSNRVCWSARLTDTSLSRLLALTSQCACVRKEGLSGLQQSVLRKPLGPRGSQCIFTLPDRTFKFQHSHHCPRCFCYAVSSVSHRNLSFRLSGCTANNPIDICRSQAARAQRKAETYRRRMAALGQPVMAAEASPAYIPAFQQPYQGMYQDPYAAAQGYGAPQYIHAPVYPSYPDRAFPAEGPLASALQWEMPQVSGC